MISSLLDNDMYQFAMSHLIFMQGDGDIPVRYEFRNRTFAVPLAARLDRGMLLDAITAARALQFAPAEIEYLRTLGLFEEKWLNALSGFRLPPVEVGASHGHLIMEYEGPWAEAIFWETPLLAIVNELYYGRFNAFQDEGVLRLQEKLKYLADRQSIKFVEFGTRRRFSREWQHYVLHTAQTEIPNLVVGTSNVALARELGLEPRGTMAHQLFMVYTAIARHILRELPGGLQMGTRRVLNLWAERYGTHPHMMTALPDTFGTDWFINTIPRECLQAFSAFRQDSGDPIEIGMRLVELARTLDIPPKLIFSDSLDVRRMSVIEDCFEDAEVLFGWGTNLTNDLGYEPLSIVIKPKAVSWDYTWIPCVKISDDYEKATGTPEAIAAYMSEIG